MTLYVLIIVTLGSNGDFVTVAPFDTKEACEAAGLAAKDLAYHGLRYACVRQGQ